MPFVKKTIDTPPPNLLWQSPNPGASPLLILAHGAGAAMDSGWMDALCIVLGHAGVNTVRFEFPYMSNRRMTGKKSAPNRSPVLLDTWRAVLNHPDIINYAGHVYIGGKSMGGRMATLICAGDTQTQRHAPQPVSRQIMGCVCYGYPFHPPGQLENSRIAHLGKTYTTPTLICQGERDTFGTREQVADYPLSSVITLAWIPMANHDLKPLKSSGYTLDDMFALATNKTAQFMGL